MVDAVIQRWDAFLDKTRTRASDLLAEASGVCSQSIATGESDPNNVFAGWDAVARRTRELAHKVHDV